MLSITNNFHFDQESEQFWRKTCGHPFGFLVLMLVAITTINNCSIQQKKINICHILNSVCLGFQAFVHLLWSDRSYARTCSHWTPRDCAVHVPSRQNMWSMLLFFFYASHINDEYCLVLGAAMKLTVL